MMMMNAQTMLEPELEAQHNAQLEGLAIGLEQRGEKSAAHIIRLALNRLAALPPSQAQDVSDHRAFGDTAYEIMQHAMEAREEFARGLLEIRVITNKMLAALGEDVCCVIERDKLEDKDPVAPTRSIKATAPFDPEAQAIMRGAKRDEE